MNIDIVDFEDGHYPGFTSVTTRLAVYNGKHSSQFLSIFDDLLDVEWCERAYEYAMHRAAKPWGMYCCTALD